MIRALAGGVAPVMPGPILDVPDERLGLAEEGEHPPR